MAENKPVDVPEESTKLAAKEPVQVPQILGATFAERAAARAAAEGKVIAPAEAEDKAVRVSESKSRRAKK